MKDYPTTEPKEIRTWTPEPDKANQPMHGHVPLQLVGAAQRPLTYGTRDCGTRRVMHATDVPAIGVLKYK